MKKILFAAIFLLISFIICGQTSYVVSGIVTKDGSGIENAKIFVVKLPGDSNDETTSEQIKQKKTTSNSVGRFHFTLEPGKYEISCEYISPVAIPHELFAIGPEAFEVTDKSIEDLEFKIVDDIGYIEDKKSLLDELPDTILSVNYKWGNVPLFSVEECKLKAEGFLDTLKDEDVKDVLNGSALGIPLKIYDMNGNVVFYQFPITNLDTRIGYIGVHAIGVKPEESNFFNYPSISLKELNDRLIEFKDKNFLLDSKIPELKKKTASLLKIDQGELMFKRFLSLGPDAFSFYIVFTKFPDEKEIIVDMNDLSILSNEKSDEQIRDESEARYTLKYILDSKNYN